MFTLRFDMRAPHTGAPTAELYSAALEFTKWAESRGALAAVINEHHATADGYLPSPMILASALAAATTTLPITVAVVLLPLYHPVRLAEEMVVLDHLSKGRVSYIAAIGYRPEEYRMYGVDYHRRGAIAEEQLGVLLRAKTGEPFYHAGRRIHVTPAPFTPGGPRVAWGGGSIPAARRAGRHGLDFFGQSSDSTLEAAFREEARAQGRNPGVCVLTPRDTTTTLFVADDLDRAWDELGPYLMHDALGYAQANKGNTATAGVSFATTVEQLRAENRSHRIVTASEAVAITRTGVPLPLHPLVGGLPPEIGWRYLQTVVEEVIPVLNAPRPSG
jgi:alkanesulfonate monooxygenase SsuD/methylene tetrahydromethanopterin reductase-like flavin-dependent oxidoreductase (luciferase family)